MNYPCPIGRDERLRRKWWKFAVANGFVSPAKKFEGKISRYIACSYKESSACNGEGSQFDYDARTGLISGFFREKFIQFDRNSAKFDSRVSMFRQKLMMDELNGNRIKTEKKFSAEIKFTKQCHRLLSKEERLLADLENKLRYESGQHEKQRYYGFYIGSSYVAMGCPPIEWVKREATIDLHLILLKQISILQKLISKRNPTSWP